MKQVRTSETPIDSRLQPEPFSVFGIELTERLKSSSEPLKFHVTFPFSTSDVRVRLADRSRTINRLHGERRQKWMGKLERAPLALFTFPDMNVNSF